MAEKPNILESVREDDFVEYFLFLPSEYKDKEEELKLRATLSEVNKIVTKYTNNYLWHREEFKLVYRSSDTTILNNNNQMEALPPHLYGVTHYGDNIEDEWFMVYLLMQITKEIEGLVARIVDADGEFLLIEAADFLPTWADPETCDKRVYIHNGSIHIITLEVIGENEYISVETALAEIHKNPHLTLASADIQNCIKTKIQDYPEKIKKNLHRANVYLPVGVAAILNHKPSLLSAAVHAFCNRDTADLKACRAMKYFPPEVRVRTSVNFTKYLYAMMVCSKYQPDKMTGWNLPPPNSPQYKAHSLGVKLACGFEILVSQAKPSADIEYDKGWHTYLKNLKEKGYFKELLEHSKEYNKLMNKAKEYYIDHRDSMHTTPVIGQEILNLTKHLDINVDELKKLEFNLPPDDDDSWLNISAEELDKFLQEQYGQKKFVSYNSDSDATDFTKKVSEFLNHVSDIEGAEFPVQEEIPVRPPRGSKRNKSKVSFSTDTKNDTASTKINFDSNSFTCAVQNILNFVIPEDDSWDLESDSDMSDYGKDDVDSEEFNKMQQLMHKMDKELAKTTIGESFKRKEGDQFDDIESFKPVDIDMNALQNILESYRSQLGEAGPSSNMLGPMGICLDVKSNNI